MWTYVEHHPVWTLVYIVFFWWPACGAVSSLGPFVVCVTKQERRGRRDPD